MRSSRKQSGYFFHSLPLRISRGLLDSTKSLDEFVEAKREEAKHKADLEERMIKVKEAKVCKELMVEEKEHMLMSNKGMDEDQLQWWKDYKDDIAERKRIGRASCRERV